MSFKALKISFAVTMLVGLILAGCTGLGKTPAPLPTVMLDNPSGSPTTLQATGAPSGNASSPGAAGGVTASGAFVPMQQAQLAFASAGRIESLDVALGDQVTAGQVLARLAGSEQAQAAVSTAQTGVLSAQQALDDLVRAQPLKVAQAQSDLEKARTALDDLQHPNDAVLHQAQKAVLDAQTAVDDAQKFVDSLSYGRASETALSSARAAYVIAQSEVDRLQKVYNHTGGDPEKDPPKALALSNLDGAIAKRDRTLIDLNWLEGKPTQEEIDQKNNDLALAKGNLAEAQTNLNKLANPSAADIALAQATIAADQSALDDWNLGASASQVLKLKSLLKSAQDGYAAAQASLANLELKAPFDGTVGKVTLHSSEWALPGQAVLVLADLQHLRVETTDLSERDVAKVAAGQPVSVTIKALDQDITGHVVSISPLADTLGGDVVYKTVIALDTLPAGVRAGMSVDVHYK